jgi:predicted ArsR family transcriptional regulator
MIIMKLTTRLRILEYFRKYQTASVRELSSLLEMTGANIRHHLAMLELNDLIEIVGQRREGRGRPLHVYGLSRRVQGDGLDILAGTVLDIFLGQTSERKREDSIRLLAERIAGETAISGPVRNRLVRVIARLNQIHYQARWEATPAGPRIILGHCPYLAIIAGHPELCRMDTYLLEVKLGFSVAQVAKLQMNEKGLPLCAFLMGKKVEETNS